MSLSPIRSQILAALRKAIEAAQPTAAWAGAYPWHEPHPAHNEHGAHAGIIVPASYFSSGLQKAEPDFSGGEAHAQNEQASIKGTSKQFHIHAAPFGTVNKANPSVLKHYPLEGKAAAVDALAQHHGYTPYLMGGRHGKPDLQNRHFGTGHLAIWDPSDDTTGSGRDADYQKAWRVSHELAHAITLPQLNQKYGEGRRMGALGKHRTLREAKRAVEWEHMAAHTQRKLLSQIGVNIPDEDFNREYHTVMADAIHRATTGKFVDPQAEGFKPHSTHQVPLSTSLGMVDEAGKQMGLKGEHDLLGRP